MREHWAPGMRDRATGAYRRALELGEERRKINPRDAHMLSYLAGYHAMLGEKQKARLRIDEAEKLALKRSGSLVLRGDGVRANRG